MKSRLRLITVDSIRLTVMDRTVYYGGQTDYVSVSHGRVHAMAV